MSDLKGWSVLIPEESINVLDCAIERIQKIIFDRLAHIVTYPGSIIASKYLDNIVGLELAKLELTKLQKEILIERAKQDFDDGK
jgi:hypothetical protein